MALPPTPIGLGELGHVLAQPPAWQWKPARYPIHPEERPSVNDSMLSQKP